MRHGFSLVEVCVGAAILLLVLASLGGVLHALSRAEQQLDRVVTRSMSRALVGARLARDLESVVAIAPDGEDSVHASEGTLTLFVGAIDREREGRIVLVRTRITWSFDRRLGRVTRDGLPVGPPDLSRIEFREDGKAVHLTMEDSAGQRDELTFGRPQVAPELGAWIVHGPHRGGFVLP